MSSVSTSPTHHLASRPYAGAVWIALIVFYQELCKMMHMQMEFYNSCHVTLWMSSLASKTPGEYVSLLLLLAAFCFTHEAIYKLRQLCGAAQRHGCASISGPSDSVIGAQQSNPDNEMRHSMSSYQPGRTQWIKFM